MKKLSILTIFLMSAIWLSAQRIELTVTPTGAPGTYLVEWVADGEGKTVQHLQLSYVGGKKQGSFDPGIGFVAQHYPNITELSGSRLITPGVHYSGAWYTIIARVCTGPNAWDIECDQKTKTVKK